MDVAEATRPHSADGEAGPASELRARLAETYADSRRGPVAVASGYGIRVSVERGHLVVLDGVGDVARTRRWSRANHGLSRLVILSSSGDLSLSALKWCIGVGIGVTVIDPFDQGVLFVSAPRVTDDARLRRIQALAPGQPVGLGIAHHLLTAKLRGQAHVVRSHFGDEKTGATILELAEALSGVTSVEDARQIEATAAALYFGAWSDRPETAVRFATRDAARVPRHWSSFEGRRSVLGSAVSNRKAERPVNALLNYCFALLEVEAIFACYAVGIDPGLAVVHADAKARQSMALDLMEPVRPEVEGYVLELLGRRTFRKADLTETVDGHVRLRSSLTQELAESMPKWARALAPHAEKVAHMLGAAMEGKYQAATPLTGRRTRDAQAVVKARREAVRQAAVSTTTRQRANSSANGPARWTCPDCGGAVSHRHRVRCDACIAKDARQTVNLRATRAAAISARRQAEAAFTAGGGAFDPDHFASAILPALATVRLSAIVTACGVSKGTASYWRAGKWTPHPSHWAALANLAGVEPHARQVP